MYRAFGFGQRKPAGLAFERVQVSGKGASDDLQGHRSAADGTDDFVGRYEIFAHWSFMHSMAECNLDADQHIGKKAPRGLLLAPPPDAPRQYFAFPQNVVIGTGGLSHHAAP
jgi:hypothetical protein